MYESDNMAARIKSEAKKKQVTLKTMIVDLGFNANTMSAMYHGKMIGADRLARIADYLDCSVDYLLGRTDNPEVNR